jgi:general secretion pathway protein K
VEVVKNDSFRFLRKVKRQRSGMALMLSLWALFLLSAMLIAWAIEINAKITISGEANRALEAEAEACSGAEVALALPPPVKAGSPLLKGSLGTNQSYEVKITGEAGRMNISWLITQENPVKLEILRKYLEIKGVDLNERDKMIDCLLDWVDADNLVRLNGAEDEPNYHPRNAPLRTVDELKKVRGWAEFTSNPDWDKDFTLYSIVPIDPTSASREVLLALPGMTEQRVDQFLTLRRGPDGIDGTADDTEFKNLGEVEAALGIQGEAAAQFAQLLSFKDPMVRIVSVGRSGSHTHEVEMVVQKLGGGQASLKMWHEQ